MAKNLHLLEPYRSALLSMGHDERLVSIEGGASKHSASLQVGKALELRQDTLQLLFLFEDASIAWTESKTATELAPFQGQISHMVGEGLQAAGVVRLLRDLELEQAGVASFQHAQSLGDLWIPYIDDIAAFAPIIAHQLTARGKPISEQLIEFMLAFRKGDNELFQQQLLNSLSPSDQLTAREVLTGGDLTFLRYELPVLTQVHQCLFAARLAFTNESCIAGPALGTYSPVLPSSSDATRAAKRLVAVVAEELLGQNLLLPLPRTLKEAIDLRSRPGIPEFRELFFPWLNTLLEGDSREEARLRREVKGMLKGSSWAPKVRRLSRLVQYVGVASDVVGLVSPLTIPGLGLAVTAVSGGAERLAARFESKSRWLMCTTSGAG